MRDTERNLVQLLCNESSKVVERVERVGVDLDLELKRLFPENYENKRLQFNQKYQKFKKNLEKNWLIITLQRSWISREKRCKKIVNLLILLKIHRTLQITDSIEREKPNFIVMLLNPLIHLLKKLQNVVRLLLI